VTDFETVMNGKTHTNSASYMLERRMTSLHLPGSQMPPPGSVRAGNQRGVALVIALILLIVVTLLGLTAVRTTTLQNKMAANQYDRQLAFQASAAALLVAGDKIRAAAATQSAPAGFEDCSSSSNVTC